MKKLLKSWLALVLALTMIALPALADGVKNSNTWRCEECETLNSGNFCGECGAARPSSSWECAICGQENKGNFCTECGAQRGAQPEQATQEPSATAPAALLMSDAIPDDADNLHIAAFGSDVERRDVLSITMLASTEDAPSDAIDISAAGDGGVLLWFEDARGGKYDMYIAAQGRIMAPRDCSTLFSYYIYCEEINLNGCLDTSNVTVMDEMFSCCWELRELSGLSFDTSKVTSMWFMFSSCHELASIDLSSFDTSSVADFSHMFWDCDSLEELDISNFVISSGARTSSMFDGCDSLPASAYSHIADSLPTATPRPTSTPKPTSAPRPAATESTYYPELSRGDSGSRVKRLQQYLIRYGYMADGEDDGSYGRKTAEAVHRFKQQNGISDLGEHYATDCVATNAMQQRLFGGSATYYYEPDFPLSFPSGSMGQWQKVSGDKLKIRFEVTNISDTRTVTAFKVLAYATDVWGDKLYDDLVYYETTTRTVEPSDYKWSEYIYLPDCSDIDTVYARISEVRLSDGSYIENDSYDYANWTITYD